MIDLAKEVISLSPNSHSKHEKAPHFPTLLVTIQCYEFSSFEINLRYLCISRIPAQANSFLLGLLTYLTQLKDNDSMPNKEHYSIYCIHSSWTF